jgi:CDP-glycerol glycerophosphotransferase (TagB/SpsB family)
MGYPKSDIIYDKTLLSRIAEVKAQLNLKYDFSVLYAPSWENDGKEDDYIKALADLPVNLLIKQCHWSEEYEEVINNINNMRKLHEGKFENVYYIEPEESIMVALGICDMVVSDESSVMAEAAMFGKPSIAVTNWLVMDTNPHRLVSVPMDFVIKSTKEDLHATVEELMNNPEQFADILEKGKNNFSNQGCVCRDIMDAIEYYAFGKEAENGEELPFMKRKLKQRYETFSLWN